MLWDEGIISTKLVTHSLQNIIAHNVHTMQKGDVWITLLTILYLFTKKGLKSMFSHAFVASCSNRAILADFVLLVNQENVQSSMTQYSVDIASLPRLPAGRNIVSF